MEVPMKNRYMIFFAMIATSVAAMFAMTYLNTWEPGHVFWSETRAYMVLYMGAVMAVVMLAWMLPMYTSRTANIAIVVGATVVFSASLFLVRSQATVSDVSWMKAMIPHHSIAILTSSRADISDPRVRKLADEIIDAQKLEIDEMKALERVLLRWNRLNAGHLVLGKERKATRCRHR
jgi:hypothetical protein